MSDNPLANILARLVGERSDVASRAFERAAFDYAMTRGCDLGRDGEAYARLRVVTSAVRDGDYNEAWMRGALDALRDAIYSSRSRAEELRRRVDEALRAPTPDALFGLTYDSAKVFVEGRRVDAMEYLTSPRGRERAEADARAAWRERVLSAIGAGEFRCRSCAACGRWSFPCVLCSECSGVDSPWNRLHATPSALSRWRERIAQRQRHAAPVPLDVLGGVCASRLYPEAPRADDTVRLRCPLRRSPDRGVTLCVAQPTTDCVTPTRREA